MPRMDEDIEHQIDLRILRDVLKIVRQLGSMPADSEEEGENKAASVDRRIKLIGKLAALGAVGAIKDPNIRLRALPLIKGM